MKRTTKACLGTFLLLGAMNAGAATAADSGWVDLFNGTNFNGLYVYAKANTNGQAGYGRITIPKDSTNVRIGTQTVSTAMFRVDTGKTIRVGTSPNGYIGTILQYSYYHVRVEYQWPLGTSAAANAGLLIHIDSAQVASSTFNTSNNRPCSIEVNMKRDATSGQAAYGGDPFTLWSAQNLGPYITTTVDTATLSGPRYKLGGVSWTDDPFGNRTIFSTVQNPEKPLGQWNLGEAYMYGADSGVFVLNNVVRTRGYNFQVRANAANSTPRIPYSRGNIVLQSEGSTLYYRNFQIQLIDSASGKPTALLARERAQRLSGNQLMLHFSGSRLEIPRGYSGAELYNLQGKKVWSYRGTQAVEIPTHATAVLRVKYLL